MFDSPSFRDSIDNYLFYQFGPSLDFNITTLLSIPRDSCSIKVLLLSKKDTSVYILDIVEHYQMDYNHSTYALSHHTINDYYPVTASYIVENSSSTKECLLNRLEKDSLSSETIDYSPLLIIHKHFEDISSHMSNNTYFELINSKEVISKGYPSNNVGAYYSFYSLQSISLKRLYEYNL